MRKSFFGIYHPLHKICLLAADLLCIFLAFYVASTIRLGVSPNYISLEFFGLSLIIVSTLFVGNGYTSNALGSQPRLPLNTFFMVIASTVPSTLFIYFLGPERFTELFGRGIFPVAIILLGALSVITRVALNFLFNEQHKDRVLLVLGDVQSQHHFDTAIKQGLIQFKLIHTDSLLTVSDEQHFDAIVVTPEHIATKDEQQKLISARLEGVPIFSLSDFFESFLFLVPVNEINNDWFIRAEGFTMLHSSVATRIKRAVDLLAAAVLFIATLPIMVCTALLIKLTSKGPFLFSQTRVGMQGKQFTLYKFRTMHMGAEAEGAQWASTEDSRIIPFGGFLRKTRIDELPQCWNILKGEMSIVGPRPERPEFTSQLAQEIPYYDLRHIVKPGLTGWAQVSYPYGASIEDSLRKLQYDLYYIKNHSLLLDLNILLRTVLVTLRRSGR